MILEIRVFVSKDSATDATFRASIPLSILDCWELLVDGTCHRHTHPAGALLEASRLVDEAFVFLS